MRRRCKRLHDYVTHKLAHYPERHGKPEWTHQPALAVSTLRAHRAATPSRWPSKKIPGKRHRGERRTLFDQLITWRELSINFAHFNPLYDSIESAPDWAHRTLGKHARTSVPSPTRARNSRTQRPTMNYGTPRSGRCFSGLDAQLHAHVLGKKNPGVEPVSGLGLPSTRLPQRQVFPRWPRPQRLCWHRVVDRRQVRPALV